MVAYVEFIVLEHDMALRNVLCYLMLLAFLLTPNSYAYAVRRTICRGTNRPLIILNLKKEIKKSLIAQKIAVRSVKVELLIPERSTSTFDFNFATGIQITPSPFSVSYNGELPNPADDCTVNAALRITVTLKDGTISQTTTDYTLSGKMLVNLPGTND